MARLERLARNGSGKENLVAKCPGKEKSRIEVSDPSAAGAVVTARLKSWDLNLKLVERNLNAAIVSHTSKHYKF